MNLRLDFYLRASFLVAVVATTGSLFFSEVMKFPPCSLCWYQRICMYPLVFILGMGLFKTGRECIRYALGLIATGWVIAIYHNLLYYGIVPEEIIPCTQGVSCSAKMIEWLGFITIPLLSLTAFTLLLLLSIFALKTKDSQHEG